MAPEIFEFFYYYDGYGDEQPVDSFSIASDIWSLGCLFFYFLTRGVHPYGDDNDIIPWKILMKKNPVKLEGKSFKEKISFFKIEIIEKFVFFR
jgi:serine/threonine protein kinase